MHRKYSYISYIAIFLISIINNTANGDSKISISERPWEKPSEKATPELSPFSVEEIIDISTNALVSGRNGFAVCDRHDKICGTRLDMFNKKFFPVTSDFQGCSYAGFSGTSGEPGKIEKTLNIMWSILHDPNEYSEEWRKKSIQSYDADFENSVGRSCTTEQYEIFKKITRTAYTAAMPIVTSQISIAEQNRKKQAELEAKKLLSKQKIARTMTECQQLKKGFNRIKLLEENRELLPGELALKANLLVTTEIIGCGSLDETW